MVPSAIELETLTQRTREQLAACALNDDLLRLKAAVLGRTGVLSEMLKGVRDVPQSERPAMGQLLNRTKATLEELFRNSAGRFTNAERAGTGRLDVTLPGRFTPPGGLHPLLTTIDEMVEILERLGFVLAEGPEIELEKYNFENLNIPAHHPARDLQDTFYVSDGVVLRTHTSPIQIRSMLQRKPPLAVICPGAAYRRDADITHSPMFHQVECLMVDRGLHLGHLKGVLNSFLQQLFGAKTEMRLRASYFPFTEPSAEVDIQCILCAGAGCRICKQSGWLEVLGCGMVHPQVLRNVGIDPEHWSGFAFGVGVERIAMVRHGVKDIRLFFENDLRFLRQFS